ncbi:MAG: hypothetical protein V1646_03735 [bacterium]
MLLKNNLFSLLFLASFLFNGLNATVEVDSSSLFVPVSLDGVRLFHDKIGFTVVKDGDEFPVKTECLDKELINLSDEDLDFVLGLKAKIEIDGEEQTLVKISPELAKTLIAESKESFDLSTEDSEKIISQLQASRYIQVFQFSDGEYGLHLKTRLPGGGFFGAVAGALVGKATVHVLAHGAIFIACRAIDVVAPGAGVAAQIAIEAVAAPAIEAASLKAAIVVGAAAMVATGPV